MIFAKMCESANNEFFNPLERMIGRNDVVIHVSHCYNREKLPTELEENIEKVWQTRLKDNPRLFNGTKFRLFSMENNKDNKMKLCIGVTCYKDFLGTNYSPQAKELSKLGGENHKNSQAYMSDAIGVGALLLTADNDVVVIKRSQHVAEDVGLYDRPGGHAEPSELVGDIPLEQIDLQTMSPDAVRDEIFNSIIREVRDEVNIPANTLADPLLLGAYRNPASSGRPGLEFLIRCSLTSQQVSNLYHQGTQTEADESTAIKFIRILELENINLWSEMTYSMKFVLKYFTELNSV